MKKWNMYEDFLQRDWLYFIAIVEAGSFTHAAEQLGIQQNALSKSIKRLEDRLNQPLLYRLARGAKPTEYGMNYYNLLNELNQSWDERISKYSNQQKQIVGEVHLGAHPVLCAKYLTPTLGTLPLLEEGLQIRMTLKSSIEVSQAVIKREIDMGVVIDPVCAPDLVMRPLSKESIFLYSRKKSAVYPVVYYHPQMKGARPLLKKIKFRKLIALADYEIIARVLSHGDGAGLLPESTRGMIDKRVKKVSRALATVTPTLIFRSDQIKTRAFEAVKESIVRLARGG